MLIKHIFMVRTFLNLFSLSVKLKCSTHYSSFKASIFRGYKKNYVKMAQELSLEKSVVLSKRTLT